jgi:hypothetical protein
VTIQTDAMLIQDPDGNFQTDDGQGGDHEWGKDSFMHCCDCGKTGESRDFEVPDDYLEMRRFIEKLARMNYDGEEGAGDVFRTGDEIEHAMTRKLTYTHHQAKP